MKRTVSNYVLIALCLSAAFMLINPGLKSSEYESSVLATVNGDPITLYDVFTENFRDESVHAAAARGELLNKEIQQDRKRIVDELIDRKLLYAEFISKEYKIPDQFIEELIDEIAANVSGGDRLKLEKKIAEKGMTINDLREKAVEKTSVDILLHEFCYKNVCISPKEVYDYYKNNIKDYSKPAQIELQFLFLKKKTVRETAFDTLVDKIKNDMKNADASIFETLVKLYSDGPNAEKGGKTGWMDEDKISPEFQNIIKDMKQGEIKGPFEFDEGVYFLRYSGKINDQNASFEEVQSQIEEKLKTDEKKRRYNEYMKKLKDKAVIRYFF